MKRKLPKEKAKVLLIEADRELIKKLSDAFPEIKMQVLYMEIFRIGAEHVLENIKKYKGEIIMGNERS